MYKKWDNIGMFAKESSWICFCEILKFQSVEFDVKHNCHNCTWNETNSMIPSDDIDDKRIVFELVKHKSQQMLIKWLLEWYYIQIFKIQSIFAI